MSVLKKIGIFLASAGSDITKVLGFPFISQLLGLIPGKIGQEVQTITTDLNLFASYVSLGETMFPAVAGAKTGSDKLKAVSPLFQKAILLWAQANLPGHNKLIVPVEKFQADVANFTGSFADIMNDFGD